MQRPRPLDVVEIAFEVGDTLPDQPAVDFELAFAGPAEKAKTAALALEVGPRANQPRSLIGKRGQFDLQAALVSARPRAENFEDQTGPVDDLRPPAPFEVALLHRAQRTIDDDDPDSVFADQLAEIFEGPAAEQAIGPRARDARDLGADDIETDRPCEADCFLQSRFDRTARKPR
jgi:hypothetical protein